MADYRQAGGNNVYTVLAFIAALVLAIGVGYIIVRHVNVFGGNPFQTAPITTTSAAPAITTTA